MIPRVLEVEPEKGCRTCGQQQGRTEPRAARQFQTVPGGRGLIGDDARMSESQDKNRESQHRAAARPEHDWLKSISQVEHTRHRSPTNVVGHLTARSLSSSQNACRWLLDPPGLSRTPRSQERFQGLFPKDLPEQGHGTLGSSDLSKGKQPGSSDDSKRRHFQSQDLSSSCLNTRGVSYVSNRNASSRRTSGKIA